MQVYAQAHYNYKTIFEEGPFFKLTIARLAAEEQYLVMTLHHVISDETSVEVLKKEIKAAYQHLQQHEKLPVLPPLPYQYKDYAHWVNYLLASKKGQQLKARYIARIKDSIEAQYGQPLHSSTTQQAWGGATYRNELAADLKTALPQGNFSDFTQAYGLLYKLYPEHSGASYDAYIKPAAFNRLKRLAHETGRSLFAIVMAMITLQAYAHDKNRYMRLFIPFTTRVLKEFENIVGWLTADVVACVAVHDNMAVTEYIDHVNDTIIEAAECRFYPHEHLLNDLNVPLSVLTPYFINYIQEPGSVHTHFEPQHHKEGSGHFCYRFDVKEMDNCLKFTIHYNLKVANKDQITRLMQGISHMLHILPDSNSQARVNRYCQQVQAMI